MARARNIKPGFFTNEELVELPFSTRLLFIGLWTVADREGRLEDRPKRIKMDLFPADSIDIDAALNELQASGFLLRYTVKGTRYIQVLAFKKHQNPHKDERASTIPAPEEADEESKGDEDAPCEHGASTVQAPEPHGGNLADSLIPDSPNPDSPKPDKKTPVAASADVVAVFDYWRLAMGHSAAKLDKKRRNAIGNRLSDGYTVGDLCRAVDGCKLSPHHMGQNESKTVYDDIELICRDGPKVDGFLKRATQGAPSTQTAAQQQTISNLQRYLDRRGNGA